ncbi:MAG: hypothetical protein ACLFQ6_05410 [Candidatus Sumerlaeia bacterium]
MRSLGCFMIILAGVFLVLAFLGLFFFTDARVVQAPVNHSGMEFHRTAVAHGFPVTSIIILGLIGGAFILGLIFFLSGGKSKSRRTSKEIYEYDEIRRIQELHRELDRMMDRVQNLETILLERTRRN